MDTETARPKAKTYLRIPFADGVVRAIPFEPRHAVALSMAKHLKTDQGRFDAIIRLVAQVIHEADYPDIFEALVERDGGTTEQDVFKLLRDIVEATAKYRAELGESAPGE